MLVSKNLINKFVNLDGISNDELLNKLTFAGIEVAGYYPLANATNLVIGEVLECELMENSDHLHVTKVNLGPKHGVHQIVCGAPNVRTGLKVIVALPGAKLPHITIKKATIKGVESDGMICSLTELGVDQKFLEKAQIDGIEELDNDAEVGNEDVLGYLMLDDTVFDVRPLPNRSDTLAVINLAREISSLFNRPFKDLTFDKVAEVDAKATVNSLTSNSKLFAIKEVYGVKVKDSPLPLKRYLMASGQRAINNVVDIANFVMILTGQPLHMYDIDKLPSLNFVVKDDKKGPFVALDDKTYDLINGDIAITVDDEVMCLGGVMGAKKCMVDENSKNIAIEAAHFAGPQIRSTSTRLNLPSEASKLFARGVNPHQSEYVLNLTAYLLKKYADVKVVSKTVAYDNISHELHVITGNDKKINGLLGTEFTSEEIDEVLTSLNFKVERLNKNGDFKVTVPSFRLDVEGVPDLAEEVIRIRGFENIKETLPVMETKVGGRSKKQERIYDIRKHLRSLLIHETVNYTLVNEELLSEFHYLNDAKPYKILNPMTPLHEYVRTHVLPSLLETAKYNYARQLSNFALFEISEVYGYDMNNVHLAVVFVGNKKIRNQLKMRPYDFFDAKGIMNYLINYLGINKSRMKLELLDNPKEYHPYRSAKFIIDGELVAVGGELHPTFREAQDFAKTPVVTLEVNLTKLFSFKVSKVTMKDIPRFPSVRRDFALVIDDNIASRKVINAIKKVDHLIYDVAIFDEYHSDEIGKDKKSLALNVTYQSFDATLTDAEITALDEKITSMLASTFNAALRK